MLSKGALNGSDSNGTALHASEEELRREIERLQHQLEEISPAPRKNSTFSSTSEPASENSLKLDSFENKRQSETQTDSQQTPLVAPPQKSGYLFKWQDRSIGWGGTKWGLRFVRLENGQLSYYKSHEDKWHHPRYAMTLKNCAVRDEGSKINKRQSLTKGGDIGDKPAGSYFYVFSIYQRPVKSNSGAVGTNKEVKGTDSQGDSSVEDAQNDKEEEIVPLLRFSTQSLAEKNQWIDLISQSCAFCDTEEFEQWQNQQKQELLQLGPKGHVTRTEKGTLPKLIFESAKLPPHVSGYPSGYNLTKFEKDGQRHLKTSTAKDAARSNKISYPPSKPMHRQSSPSYLSEERADVQNYRGLFNLLLIILIVSNFRLLLDAITQHGFILWRFGSLGNFWKDFWEAPLAQFPFITGLFIVQAFVVGAYVIELMLSRCLVGNRVGMFLHFVNSNGSLGVVMAIVWYLVENPIAGAALILQAAITWLKLISYAHANYDYRATSLDTHKATLALVKDLDLNGLAVSYPQNVTLWNIYYFWLAPSLTYQIAFPRTPMVRWYKVMILSLQLFASAALIAFLGAQVIAPNLDHLLRDLEANKGEVRTHVIGEYLLKLSITSTYIWLLVFYGFFHCFMNLTAELLRFGDRVFYRDWWNASEVSAYWRLWNMPVHYWLVRHVYFPSIRIGLSKKGATFIVFLISAIMHEILISIPCHMIRAWSFLAMMGQIPLILLTKYIDKRRPGSSIGNFIFWISFCFVGQPMAILLYTVDYWEENESSRMENATDFVSTREPAAKQMLPFAAIGRFFGASSEL